MREVAISAATEADVDCFGFPRRALLPPGVRCTKLEVVCELLYYVNRRLSLKRTR
jgi:hypothetical protein